jgi:peptidoglycan-associated lipoprotein
MKVEKMKATKFVNLMAIGLALAFVSTGCKHRPVNVTEIPNPRPGRVPDIGSTGPVTGGESTTGGTGASGTGIAANPAGSHAGWKQDESALAADTVYFAYDSSVIKAGEKSKISAVADYLKSNPSAAVEVDGHCDERGTEEYNRSLGERRALAIREDLAALGIEPGRVDTISFGKDKPLIEGHTEAAWSKNRCGIFVVLTPP